MKKKFKTPVKQWRVAYDRLCYLKRKHRANKSFARIEIREFAKLAFKERRKEK